MIISGLNSIKFKLQDSNPPNINNTLLADEKFYNDNIFTYCQRWPDNVTQKVQIKSDSDTLPTAIATEADQSTTALTVTEVSSYDTDSDGNDDTYYFEFTVDFSAFTTKTDITVNQGSVTYKSEPFKGDSEVANELADGELQKIDYYNQDNAFQIDFSTGITFEIYVPAILKDLDSAGEISSYDNQYEITKLKETVQRVLSFRTLDIPRYLAETLKLVSSTDNLVVNEISYIRQDQPEITPVEGSNFVEFSMALTDKEYLGINTHDTGFNCDVAPTDAEMSILTILNASGGETFTIPAGYLVHTLRGQWVSGTTVEVKLGTSIGGDQLVYPRDLSVTDTNRTTAIHGDIDRDADTDIYATVTGGVANLDLQIIQNKETGT
jgi:hypothetical protein